MQWDKRKKDRFIFCVAVFNLVFPPNQTVVLAPPLAWVLALQKVKLSQNLYHIIISLKSGFFAFFYKKYLNGLADGHTMVNNHKIVSSLPEPSLGNKLVKIG